MSEFDVIIIGAGAAGLMCALTAGQRGRRVLLLDHNSQAGAKILISGGGRCNFTNTNTAPDRFISDNPHFCRSALGRYTPQDFISLVEQHGIAYHEKALGQLFCDGSARAIVEMLLQECRRGRVENQLGIHINSCVRAGKFRVETDQGAYSSESLVLATGSLSIPKMGATGFAHDIARQFGLHITGLRPGLVPLTFGEDLTAIMRPLSGVAFDSEISVYRRRFREAALFTHRGLSGPATLQISSYWTNGPICVNLLPGHDAAVLLLDAKRRKPRSELRTVLAEKLPQRLAHAFAGTLQCETTRMADIPDAALRELAGRLSAWIISPDGSEGYAKAEVTVGGVDTRDLSSRTMQANGIPGLFVIGEAVDVTGWLGGYNFQWAWASGWCAGQAV
jgi:predicted Rossmann fold flavoprotein